MTDLVLSSRQASGAVPPAQPLTANLSEVERVCNMIAAGGEMVPMAYRGKPGAVLLAKLWGDANGVDLFTAIQNISPIEGRPYVAAEMRVALAVAKGFEFRTIEATRETCTLEVWRGAEKLGSITACIDDQPRKLKTAKGYDTPWATHPDDMLFAEACRKADRRHVRTAAALLDAGQDYTDAPDPLTVLANDALAAAKGLPWIDAETGEPLAVNEAAGVRDSNPQPPAPRAGALSAKLPPDSPVPDMVADDPAGIIRDREAHLLNAADRAGLKAPKVSTLKQGSEIARHAGLPAVANLRELCHPDNDQVYQAVLDWIETQ